MTSIRPILDLGSSSLFRLSNPAIESSRRPTPLSAAKEQLRRGETRAQPMTLHPGPQHVRIVMIAIPASARDERVGRINRLARIEKKVAAVGVSEPMTVFVCMMHMRGIGIERIDIKPKKFKLPK